MDPAAPLLFFDSGVGGLSVLQPTRSLLPNAPIVYVADSAGFPYGERSETDVAARVPTLLAPLVEQIEPRLVVIACNTASTIALDAVRAALDLPVVGTVPAIKPAAELSKSRVIGVLGTQATVRQPYVDDLMARFASDCTVIRHGSPELVELAEAKLAGDGIDVAAVRAAAQLMFDAERGEDIDVVVLACTHFPLLDHELRQAFPGVALVDGGSGISRRIAYLTHDQAWPAAASPGIALFTGAAPGGPLRRSLARFGLEDVRTL
ncbi:MAG: glutamate racemase [Sphingomicrobium sp.]